MSLVVNGYSENQLWASLKELGLPYSQDELNKIKDQLIEKLNDFKQRELKDVAFSLFIDGYPTEVKEKGKVRKACVYIVLGIDLEGKKDVYGFYTFLGMRTEQIGSDHQLCYVHLQRNVRKNMGKGDAKFFNAELKRIRDCKDYEEGRERFENLCEQFKNKYPTFIKYVNGKIEKYLCFLKYPEEIKKHIYTTNGVESLNSLLKKIRARLGGYFQSIAILEINILLQIENLKENKWKKGIPAFKAKAYEINQIFNLKFYYEKETQNY